MHPNNEHPYNHRLHTPVHIDNQQQCGHVKANTRGGPHPEASTANTSDPGVSVAHVNACHVGRRLSPRSCPPSSPTLTPNSTTWVSLFTVGATSQCWPTHLSCLHVLPTPTGFDNANVFGCGRLPYDYYETECRSTTSLSSELLGTVDTTTIVLLPIILLFVYLIGENLSIIHSDDWLTSRCWLMMVISRSGIEL